MADENINPEDLKEKVLAAIKTVYDPEIPVNIYDLGLIYEINIFPINSVFILMTLTSPSCPSAGEIPGEVEMKIKEIEGVNDVKVELTFDPPYTQDMMSEVAKLELGFL
ncbi:MAG TPA: SUF system Fe-S cluster assembly protein [Cytophagales bacterium]|nr:SUF system Fe-S cluster assembly protein [Cytophagales bacterium]